ncbi:MAG TPA: cytochrome c [Caulobacteraceae bacterium]|nr:cytochrome c [Caulobacteraceae bacterium]
MSLNPRLLPSVILLAVACSIGACATVTSLGRPDSASERGRQIASRDCAGCHAIDRKSDGPRLSAPSFSDIRARYNRFSLAREFVAIGQSGHYQMPPTQISESESGDLIAYIESLGP